MAESFLQQQLKLFSDNQSGPKFTLIYGNRLKGYINCSHLKTFWNTTFLVSLGESSYSLYMTHTLAQKILYKLLPVQGFEGSTFVFKFGIVLLYAALIFAFSFASFYLIEKPFRIKFHKTLKKLN